MRDILLLLLAFAAGCNDAISYLGLGAVFTSNMTGNTVLLGIALAQAQWLGVLRSAVALAGYIIGVAIGTAIVSYKDRHRTWPAVVSTALTVELLILLALALWGAMLGTIGYRSMVYPLIALSAIAIWGSRALQRAH
jgi:uncharacterized membrane protein YoaK (UPF0700 family)